MRVTLQGNLRAEVLFIDHVFIQSHYSHKLISPNLLDAQMYILRSYFPTGEMSFWMS